MVELGSGWTFRGFVPATKSDRARLSRNLAQQRLRDACDGSTCYSRPLARARTPYIGESVTREIKAEARIAGSMIEQRQPEWLDLKALQEYACLSNRTLREWIHRCVDPLPAVRVGCKILVRRSEFDRWLEAHQVKPILTWVVLWMN